MDTNLSSQDLKKKIDGYLEILILETDIARKSDAMQKYLEFAARFHQYSPYNIMLILLSKPDASNVAGFQTWKKMNRYVKKGEHGIPIFAPLLHKENSEKEDSPLVLNGFRIVYVFDVSQTDGEPLPPAPDWKSPEKNAELTEKLIRFAECKGIRVSFKDLSGETQGISYGSEIEIDNSAGFKTLVHEIAHSLLHFNSVDTLSREIKELQAEASALIVARHFGIEDLHSANYIALFGLDSKDVLDNVGVVQKTALEIINYVET